MIAGRRWRRRFTEDHMPEIGGLRTTRPRELPERELSRVVAAVCHESFYVAGTRTDEKDGVYAGSPALKRSFSDDVPGQNERESVLVFAGGELPAPGTGVSLKERGHIFDSGGPSCLVHLHEEDHPRFPSELNGRFASTFCSTAGGLRESSRRRSWSCGP